MAAYTVGEIRRLYWSAESGYGVTLTTALSYSGELDSLRSGSNFNAEYHYTSGSRAYQDATRGPYDVAITYRAKVRKNSTSPSWNWVNFWAIYGLGTTSGTADHLGSFSALAGKTVGASNYYNLFNGCKINSLTLSADKAAQPILFDAEIYAQYCEYDTDKAFTKLQSVTVGADPSLPTTDLIIWDGNMQIDLGSPVTIYPSKWTLTIENDLTRQYGIRVGNDALKYPVAIALHEGRRIISVELTIPHENETYVNAKIAGTAITSLTIPIDNKTITLSNGVFDADDFPELKQDKLEETVKMKFESLSIA